MSSARQAPRHGPFRTDDAHDLGIPMENKLFDKLEDAAELKHVCEQIATAEYPSETDALAIPIQNQKYDKLVTCMKKRITVLVQDQTLLTTADKREYDFSNVERSKRTKEKDSVLKNNSIAYHNARKMLSDKEERDKADWEVVEHLFANAEYYGLTHDNVVNGLSKARQQGDTEKGEPGPDKNVYLWDKAQEYHTDVLAILWPNVRQGDLGLDGCDLGHQMKGKLIKDLDKDEFIAVCKALTELHHRKVTELPLDEYIPAMKKRVTVLVQRQTCLKWKPKDAFISRMPCYTKLASMNARHIHCYLGVWKRMSPDARELMEREVVDHLFKHAAHFGLTLVDVMDALKEPVTARSENRETEGHNVIQNLTKKARLRYEAIFQFFAPIWSQAEENQSELPSDFEEYRQQAEASFQGLYLSPSL